MNPAVRPIPGPVLGRRLFGTLAALGTGALVASACTGRRPDAGDLPATEEDPDLGLVARVSKVLGDRVRLLDETVSRHPGLGAGLVALADAHRAHLAVLGAVAPPAATPSRSPTATTDAPTPSPPPVPSRPRPALAGVVAAESSTADELTRLAFGARSGPLARLVAGMAASTAMHVAALTAPLSDEVPAP